LFENLKQRRDEGGFTLIELLIVIIILAILAAIVVFAVGTTTGNAKAAACNSDAKSVEVALEAYKAQSSTATYPPTGAAGQTALTTGGPNGPWLRQWPSATVANQGYAITLDLSTAGQVDVTTGAGGPTNYDTSAGKALCDNL
jgi:general secretion pathway protein G